MSVLRPSAHSTTTSPPRPPSPPSGPPNSMNFSRRNEGRTRSAIARANVDARLVEKLHRPDPCHKTRVKSAGTPVRQCDCADPIRTSEAQAMAFDQAPARRRALQPRADAHKAALSEDGLRGLVLNSDGRQDLDRPRQCEGCVDHRFRRLGRKTLSPGLGRQRKAERKAVFATRVEADGPNRVALCLGLASSPGSCHVLPSWPRARRRRIAQPSLRDRDEGYARCSGRLPIGCKIYGSPQRHRFWANAAKAAASQAGTHRLVPDRET